MLDNYANIEEHRDRTTFVRDLFLPYDSKTINEFLGTTHVDESTFESLIANQDYDLILCYICHLSMT